MDEKKDVFQHQGKINPLGLTQDQITSRAICADADAKKLDDEDVAIIADSLNLYMINKMREGKSSLVQQILLEFDNCHHDDIFPLLVNPLVDDQ